MIQFAYLCVNLNQIIIVASSDGIMANKQLSGSLPFVINGMMTKVKSDMNNAFRIVREQKYDAIKPAVFSLKPFATVSIDCIADF